MAPSNPQLNVLLASGHLRAASAVHGERLLTLNFRTRQLQATVAVLRDTGGSPRLHVDSGFAIFAEAAGRELDFGTDCRVLPLELLLLPRDGARMLSKGSLCHAYGECIPCKFNCSDRGCKDGVLCGLCHFPHAELTRSAKRTMFRRKGSLQTCCDYKGFVGSAFHGLVEMLCMSMTLTRPLTQNPTESDEEQFPVFLKNTFLHFGGDNDLIESKRSSSVPRKLRASPKAAPAHQREHDLVYIVSAQGVMPRH